MSNSFPVSIFFVLMELFTAFYSQIPEHMTHFTYLFVGLEGHKGLVPWMWTSVILAFGAVILLINPKTRKNETILAMACGAVFISLWIEKGLGLVVTGFIPSPLETITEYVPTGTEIAITLGIWATGFLILTLLYRIFVAVRSDIDGANERSVANGIN